MSTELQSLVDQWLQPDWNVPGVTAYVTTRAGQLSQPPYDGFNTADHVGDDPQRVQYNRDLMSRHFNWSKPPQWLRQVHGIEVIDAHDDGLTRQADAVLTDQQGLVCTLHTADCLPVFFAHQSGSVVALAHAGWRGLAEGVLEATLLRLGVAAAELNVWLGPAIGPSVFEVGDEVRACFLQQSPLVESCFTANHRGRWLCDLYQIARLRLIAQGVKSISGGGFCTFTDPRFYSFRRQPVTGRMLSFIWIDTAQ